MYYFEFFGILVLGVFCQLVVGQRESHTCQVVVPLLLLFFLVGSTGPPMMQDVGRRDLRIAFVDYTKV